MIKTSTNEAFSLGMTFEESNTSAIRYVEMIV